MSKLKNFNDPIWLLWTRLKTGNFKDLLHSINYRIKHGIWYSELWDLGDDVSAYVLKRIYGFYNTGYVPSYIIASDMYTQGFISNENRDFQAEDYTNCWNIIVSKIEFYLRLNLSTLQERLQTFKYTSNQKKYDQGAEYFGRYLPYLSF